MASTLETLGDQIGDGVAAASKLSNEDVLWLIDYAHECRDMLKKHEWSLNFTCPECHYVKVIDGVHRATCALNRLAGGN